MKKISNDNDNDTSRSIGPNGKNIFEEALKLKINSRLIQPIRIINTGIIKNISEIYHHHYHYHHHNYHLSSS